MSPSFRGVIERQRVPMPKVLVPEGRYSLPSSSALSGMKATGIAPAHPKACPFYTWGIYYFRKESDAPKGCGATGGT